MALSVGTNSYGTVDEANAYFDDSLRQVSWAQFSSAVKQQALIEATRYLERMSWNGTKAGGSAQVLSWPRTGTVDKEGDVVSSASVPSDIKAAQFEIALRLALDPDTLDSIDDQTGTNIKQVIAGDVQVMFFRPVTGSKLFSWVKQLLSPYLASTKLVSSGALGGFVGGNSDLSSFSDLGAYGKTDGYA